MPTSRRRGDNVLAAANPRHRRWLALADQRRKAAKKQRRAKRLADRADRFEQHAALVAERDGDPGYPQRIRHDDGSSTVAVPDHDGHFAAIFRVRQQAFKEKFGREMGPEDPVFFDPDADEPVPMTVEKIEAMTRATAEDMSDPVARANMLASADVGYWVTEANQHTFTAHEVEVFLTAVARHLDEAP
jgi:hypothetical protein